MILNYKMKIEKLDEEISYNKIVKTVSVGINDKKVRVYYECFSDELTGEYYSDYNIDENDKTILTDEELESIEDYLPELLSCEIGHFIDIKE